MELLMVLVVSGLMRTTLTCSSGTFAQWHQRTLTWTPEVFQPSVVNIPSPSRLIPLLFRPPSFVERLASADFALHSANLSLSCMAPDQFPSALQLAILPEVWIQFLPFMVERAGDVFRTPVRSLCQFFSASENNGSVSANSVPGCQDWSSLEAWKRLRIFYDIEEPVSLTLLYSDYIRQCQPESSARTWNVSVTSLIETWLKHRDPWARRNATMPLVILSQQLPYTDYRPEQVHLEIRFWMDSKLLVPCSMPIANY